MTLLVWSLYYIRLPTHDTYSASVVVPSVVSPSAITVTSSTLTPGVTLALKDKGDWPTSRLDGNGRRPRLGVDCAAAWTIVGLVDGTAGASPSIDGASPELSEPS